MRNKIISSVTILSYIFLISCSAPQSGGVRGIENEDACVSGSRNADCTTLDFDYDPNGQITASGAQSTITPGPVSSDDIDDELKRVDDPTGSSVDAESGEGSHPSGNENGDEEFDSDDEGSGGSSNGQGNTLGDNNGLLDKLMNSVIGGIMGTIGDLFGMGNKKKKEKEKEIGEKVRQAEEIGKKIEVLVNSARDSYRNDVEIINEMTSKNYSTPQEIRNFVKNSADKYNKDLGDVTTREPEITKEENKTNESPTDPETSCHVTNDCRMENPEQQKVKNTKDYIAGAREYVKSTFTGEDAKEREGVLDAADSFADAADAHYKNGDIELGDASIEIAKRVADFVIGATPVVGDLVDIASAISGENLITGEPLSDEEAVIQAAMAISSLATGGYVGTINDIRKGGKVLKEAVKQHVKKQAKKEARNQARHEVERRTEHAEKGEKLAQDAKKKQTAKDFEESIFDKSAGERVAAVRTKADAVAKSNQWEKDNRVSKMENRTVYKDKDGNYWSVDTQHGRLEKLDSKGRHQGEYDMDLNLKKPADPSGGHDLKNL